ncbi:MAG: hypothetical protein AAGC73_04905 [Verrucomicrobiota bacterium]
MIPTSKNYQLETEDRLLVLRKTQEREIETLRQLHALHVEVRESMPFITSRQQMHLKRQKLARIERSIHVHTKRLNDCRRKIVDQSRRIAA